MKRTTSLNLTSGPILKTLSELALPIMASSMLATAYNITDMAWIGMLGAKAVAGVGVGGMYVWLSQGLASLPRMGGRYTLHRPADAGTMKRHAAMPPPLYSSRFSSGCSFLPPVYCLLIRCSDFFSLTMQIRMRPHALTC